MTSAMTKPRAKKPAASAEDAGLRSMERLRADVAAEGVVGNARVLQAFAQSQLGDVDLAEAFSAMRATAGVVHGGDLKPVEAMLMAQATSLNSIFCELARRAANQEYLPQFQAHLTLALKAQAASRATLQALAEVKNPRTPTFVRQANIAHNQQINQGAASARTEKLATSPNGLLEDPQHGNFVDPGAASTPGRADPVLAPVGALDRADHA